MIKIGSFQPKSKYAKVFIPILDSLKWTGSNKDILESLVARPNKMNKEQLIQTLANLKIRSKTVKGRKAGKIYNKLPILYISKKNSVYLILGKKGNLFTIYDSESGTYKSIDNLPKCREIITFSEIDKINSNMQKPQKKWFFNLLIRLKKEFTYIGILSFIISLLTFTTPLFIILIHTQIRTSVTTQSILFLGFVILVFVLGLFILKSRRALIMSYVGSRMGHLINSELNRRIIFLPPKYSDSVSTSSQLTRIKDFESIVDFFSGSALINFIEIPLSLLMIIGLTVISGSLSIIPIIAYILTSIIAIFSYNIYKGVNLKNINTATEKNSIQTEIVLNMTNIRLSGHKKRWLERYNTLLESSIKQGIKSQNFMVIINTISNTIINLSLILTISIGVYLVIKNRISVTVLFSTFIIISRILSPLKGSFVSISQISKLRKSIKQLDKFMSLEIEENPGSLNTVKELLKGDIQFKNIFLKYGNEITPSLINVNYLQKNGETTVITGHGGCGKSSVIKLLLGLYRPLSGYVSLDGINISQLNKIQLRRSISYLPAEPYYFPGSIKDNLYLTKPDSGDTELENVLNRVGLSFLLTDLKDGLNSNFFDIPNLDTSIIKKLNLAMFLLKDSRLCLIDGIEKGFKDSDYPFLYKIIEELKENKTVILTTNNPYFFDLGSKIITMDSGRFVDISRTDKETKFEKGK